MAVITSTTTGNFSAPGTWVGGIVPGPADDAVAATGTVVTIDTDVTVLSFQQAGTGKFVLGGGRTVSGNVIANAGTLTSGGTVEVTATTGQTATINGTVTGVSSTAANIAGIVVTGSGALVINGSVTASNGNSAGASMVYANVSCSITVNGTVNTIQPNSGNSKRAIHLGTSSTTASLSVTGTVNSSNQSSSVAAYGILLEGANNTCSVVGDVTAFSSSNAIHATGNFVSVTITGNASIGPLGSAIFAVYGVGGSSVINMVGTATSLATTSHAIRSEATGTNTGVIFQGNMIDGSGGAVAVYTRLFRITGTQTGYNQHQNTVGFPDGTPVFRVSPDQVTGMPAINNVRLGTVYGYNNELTGTVAIPATGSVALGAEVGNTTGTAALDAGSVIAVIGAQIAAASSDPVGI